MLTTFAGFFAGVALPAAACEASAGDTAAQDDTSVPKSRLRPNEYRIGAVVSSEIKDAMAMILVGTCGFEGNDRRWIAVAINPFRP